MLLKYFDGLNVVSAFNELSNYTDCKLAKNFILSLTNNIMINFGPLKDLGLPQNASIYMYMFIPLYCYLVWSLTHFGTVSSFREFRIKDIGALERLN